jgi:hypothetical protein
VQIKGRQKNPILSIDKQSAGTPRKPKRMKKTVVQVAQCTIQLQNLKLSEQPVAQYNYKT